MIRKRCLVNPFRTADTGFYSFFFRFLSARRERSPLSSSVRRSQVLSYSFSQAYLSFSSSSFFSSKSSSMSQNNRMMFNQDTTENQLVERGSVDSFYLLSPHRWFVLCSSLFFSQITLLN